VHSPMLCLDIAWTHQKEHICPHNSLSWYQSTLPHLCIFNRKDDGLIASRVHAQVANGFILVCVLLTWVLDLILDDALGCQRKQFSMDGDTAIQAYLSPDTLP
jgi:hypothetical protein